jgi:hypothetical protein
MPKILLLAAAFVVLVFPLLARAEPTPAERAACQQDAFKYCNHAIPNRVRVRACLEENVRRISPLCRGVLARTRPK